MPSNDSVRILLAGRTGVYRTLQNALGNEPSTEMLEQFCSKEAQSVFLLFDTSGETYRRALEALFVASAEILAGEKEAMDRMEGRFTRLFVGPAGLEGNPWEAFHLSKEKTIKQVLTLEVRKAYVAQGLIPSAYPAVSDDHIAIELDFLAKLALRAEDAWAAGDIEKCSGALIASQDFINEHLMKWVPKFTAALFAAKHGAAFYQETAAVLQAFLPIDLESIDELRGALPDALKG
jgi:TorA maturation chaperone TorD